MQRIYKHRARVFLVQALDPHVEIIEEWEDIVLVRMPSGERVAIYLIDRSLVQDEVNATFRENGETGIHTMYILWAVKLLPDEGQPYVPADWMVQLQSLCGGVMGYFVYGDIVDICPVYFKNGRVHYGNLIEPERLRCRQIEWQGNIWLVADFGGQPPPSVDFPQVEATQWHAVLGIDGNADRTEIRAVYRTLVKKHHPDVDASPDATIRMQMINEAYHHLMREK